MHNLNTTQLTTIDQNTTLRSAIDDSIRDAFAPVEIIIDDYATDTDDDKPGLIIPDAVLPALGSVEAYVDVIQDLDGIDSVGRSTWSSSVVNVEVVVQSETVEGQGPAAVKAYFDACEQAYIAKYRKLLPQHRNSATGKCNKVNARTEPAAGKKQGELIYLPTSYPSHKSSLVRAVKFGISLRTLGGKVRVKSDVESDCKIAALADKDGISIEDAEAIIKLPKVEKTDSEKALGHLANLKTCLLNVPAGDRDTLIDTMIIELSTLKTGS